MKNTKLLFITLSILATPLLSQAQKLDKKPLTNTANLMFGVGQITMGGFNIEGNLFYERLAFDYSHGINLSTPNEALTGADKEQGLAIHTPWTTGFGVGYRFNDWLNLRAEPKWHRFEVYMEEDLASKQNQINAYTTFTLGLGLYANFKPFKNQHNFLKGIMIAPNVRWWPNVATSLENDSFDYYNPKTDQIETHQARSIGMNNTPFFFNLSVGYAIGL